MIHDKKTLCNYLDKYHTGQTEFHQAVLGWYADIEEVYLADKNYQKEALIERLIEPDRIFRFRVTWRDDKGNARVNRGWRVQHNNALGPYKGGLRFDPSVNESILKFLAFEQISKNALTGLPMGGGKGGIDVNPKQLSFAEKEAVCQSFMNELHRHIGEDTDIPAGDMGVGATEVGLLYGQYVKAAGKVTGSLTGKGLNFGGSLGRTEATGYGCVYFAKYILEAHDMDLRNQRITVSGAGNVAIHAVEKSIQEGATVLTMSDSRGTLYCAHGFTLEEISAYKILQASGGRLIDFCEKNKDCEYFKGKKPWEIECDVAMPCATQNELNEDDAKTLIKNGLKAVSPGANMPLTVEANIAFDQANVIVAPPKAANAGGVAVSGLEMSQNAQHLHWSFEEVDRKLQNIMRGIHESCVDGLKKENGIYGYRKGANIAAFKKIASAVISQGAR